MTTTVKAIYESGTLRLPEPLSLPEKTQVTVTVRSDVEIAADGECAGWRKVSADALTNIDGTSDEVFNELLEERNHSAADPGLPAQGQPH